MYSAGLIVFREVLEAALVISIVLAGTRGIAGRGRFVWGGVGAGLLGAVVIAALAGQIATAADGIGQELLNAGILFTAVAMLGWHNVWMSRHGREIAQHMQSVGSAVNEGVKPLSVLAVVVGLAVLREGAEVVLFLYGIALGGVEALPMFSGGLIGLAVGATLGVALYTGLLRIPMRHLFTVTSWMILLLAAGMAANGAKFLVQADLLPAFGVALWDTSAFLSEQSHVGQILHALMGYTARPSGMQVIAYLATLATIGLLMVTIGGALPRRGTRTTPSPSAVRLQGTD